MSSGAGAIVLAPVAVVGVVAVAALAVPAAAVYGLVKGGQVIYHALQEEAERRRRVAEAAEVAIAKAEFDQVMSKRHALDPQAEALEVASPPERVWGSPDLSTAQGLVASAKADIERIEAGITQAEVELARQRARLAGEHERRTRLDEQADELRISRDAQLTVGADDRPSSTRASADAACEQNDRYAAALRTERAALDTVLARLAQAQGRRDHLARLAAGSGAEVRVADEPSFPGLSAREEAQRRLDIVTQDREAVKEALDDVHRAGAKAHEKRVFDAIRPVWSDDELTRTEETWRTALREHLTAKLHTLPKGSSIPREVTDALAVLESVGTEAPARAAVVAATKALGVAESHRRLVENARKDARDLTQSASVVRSADLARRCAELAADVEAHAPEWTDGELSEAINVRMPALRSEVVEAVADEQRRAVRMEGVLVRRASEQAVGAARELLDGDLSWQVIELSPERAKRMFPQEEGWVDGFLARQVGDLTTAVVVRATADGDLEVLHKNIRLPERGLPSAEEQAAGCARVTQLTDDALTPVIRQTLGDGFEVRLKVEPDRGSSWIPMASELAQMAEVDAGVKAVVAAEGTAEQMVTEIHKRKRKAKARARQLP
jgi:hypothetical protein